MIRLQITINGTDTNWWHRWNLKQNPFPQLGRAEYDQAERQLASLDGDPIKDAADIRRRLKGFDQEFVDGIIERRQPGKRVRFTFVCPERGTQWTAAQLAKTRS